MVVQIDMLIDLDFDVSMTVPVSQKLKPPPC